MKKPFKFLKLWWYFLIGWILWVIIFALSLIVGLILWNFSETITLDMEIVIVEICGQSVWDAMTFFAD